MLIVILYCILAVLMGNCILLLIWVLTPLRPFKHLCHDILGWHEPDKSVKQTYDGCNYHSKCRFCGKDIMQDSQGNWFTF